MRMVKLMLYLYVPPTITFETIGFYESLYEQQHSVKVAFVPTSEVGERTLALFEVLLPTFKTDHIVFSIKVLFVGCQIIIWLPCEI